MNHHWRNINNYSDGIPYTGAYTENLAYDLNDFRAKDFEKVFCEETERSSITSLFRTTGDVNGVSVGMDDLSYSYQDGNGNSNLLLNVSDAVSTGNTMGFVDGNTNPALDDYEYDANGNMVKDRNKGIASITYNHLNLPELIIFENSNSIEYTYNAAGVKLKKTVIEETATPEVRIEVDYLDGFQYAGEVLNFFPTAEGYVRATPAGDITPGAPPTGNAYSYVYNYTDHLGNVRLSYSMDHLTGKLKILEENHYYPFGLKHEVYLTGTKLDFSRNPGDGIEPEPGLPPVLDYVTRMEYQYKYNGFEYQDELDLNWYDYQARNYDPALGRWMNIDPLAEMSRKTSPYAYALNNPVFFIDPDGMMAEGFGQDDVIIIGTQSGEAFNQLQSAVEGQLKLTMSESGLVSYERTDMNGPLTEAAQGLIDAIDDHSVVSTVTAENINKTSQGDLMVGGAQMGTEITGPGPIFTVDSKQEVNPSVLGTMDTENGTPGSLIAHETTEAYQAGKITQQSGVPANPAKVADMNNPQSNYSRAHNAASPQTSSYNTIRYDSNGNVLPAGIGTATRADFTTQKGTLLFSIP